MAVVGESRDFAAAALAGLALFDVVMNIIDQLRSKGEGTKFSPLPEIVIGGVRN